MDLAKSSTRKRIKLSRESVLAKFTKKQEETNATLITELKQCDDERQKMRSVLEKLEENF